MLPNKSLSFIINNVKGIPSYKKRFKLIQNFQDKTGSTGVLFLQGTHSNNKIEQKWKEDFKGKVFFSQGKTNCGVLTAYFGKETFFVIKQETDRECRILILDACINGFEYILINLCNANTGKKQIDVQNNIFVLLEKFDTNPRKWLIMAGDFNLFFDSKLDAQCGNLTIKKSLARLFELKENYDLSDIWRVTNMKSKWFTFAQKHSSGFIQRRLDYMFISNTL